MCFIQCSKQDCLCSAKNNIHKNIETEYASTLIISGIADIIFIEDTCDYCIISGSETIVHAVSVIQNDAQITIQNSTTWYACKNYEKPRIRIHAQAIDSIYIHEACSFTTETPITRNTFFLMNAYIADITLELQASNFLFSTWNKAGGEFTFYGTCSTANFQTSYTSKINAINLQTKAMNFTNNSIQDCLIWVTDTLKAHTTKQGKILLKGNPFCIVKNEQTQIQTY